MAKWKEREEKYKRKRRKDKKEVKRRAFFFHSMVIKVERKVNMWIDHKDNSLSSLISFQLIWEGKRWWPQWKIMPRYFLVFS
jgi:hypothetical protein